VVTNTNTTSRRAVRYGLRTVTVSLILAAELVLPGGGASAVVSGANGKIVFTSARDGQQEIYSVNPDGTSQTRLTNNSVGDGEPAFSPNGSKIAFVSDRFTGNDGIFVMNADGTGQTRLADSFADGGPTWSPDGSRIAFVGRDNDIHAINVDGSGDADLTRSAETDDAPAWSPDGLKIAFIRPNANGVENLFTMNPDGSGQTDVTNSAQYEDDPSWSPDGSEIVLERNNPPLSGIVIVSASGAGETIVNSEGTDPVWSPDGTRIAFDNLGTADVYTVRWADGSELTNVSNNPVLDEEPDWGSATAATGLDLGVKLTDSPDPVRIGRTTTCALTVGNSGAQDATGVRVDEAMSSQVIVMSVSSSQGSCRRQTLQAVSCSLSTLQAGHITAIKVVARARTRGTATNTAHVTGNEVESNLANNTAMETTMVN